MENYVAAIDLGTTKIVTLVGEKTDSGYKIVAYREIPSKGILRGEVVNIQNVLDSLIPVVEDIRREESIEIREVYVGIADMNIRSHPARLSRNRGRSADLISEEEVKEMMDEMSNTRVSAGEKILHVIPQSFNVDDHMGVETAVGMRGTRIEGDYRLFIGRESSIEQSKLVINRTGLRLKDHILEPVASAKAVLEEDEMELGVAMLDIGGGTTDLIIYHNNIIRHTAVIPFGGNSITEDLRQGCGVSLRNAEQIKIQFGSSYSEFAPENKTVVIPGPGGSESREIAFKVIASIIEARVEEIIEAVMYEIEHSGYQDMLRAGIVITGGTSQLTNIKQFVKLKTGYDVRIASPINNISYDDAYEICKPSASTAFGLLMLGLESDSKAEYKSQVINTLFSEEELQTAEVTEAIDKVNQTKNSSRKKRNILKRLPSVIGSIGSIFENPNNEA